MVNRLVEDEASNDQSSRQERFEIKLEDEEKPELMVEFNHNDKEPSTSEHIDGSKITNMHKCCYCGKTNISKYMINVPKDKSLLNESENDTGNNYDVICRDHFNVKEIQMRKNHVPMSDLGKMNVYIYEALIRNPSQNKQLPVKKTVGKRHYCVYCGKLKCYQNMTMVTRDSSDLKQWGSILGAEFLRKVSSRTTTFICRSHFEVNWIGKRPHYLQPVADLGQDPIKNTPGSHTFFLNRIRTEKRLSFAKPVEIKRRNTKKAVQEGCFTNILIEVKKEEPYVNIHHLDDKIESEYKQQDIRNESLDGHLMSQVPKQEIYTSQDGACDLEAFKFEVEEEPFE